MGLYLENDELTAWKFTCSVCHYSFKRVSDQPKQPKDTNCGNCGGQGTMHPEPLDEDQLAYEPPQVPKAVHAVIVIAIMVLAIIALLIWGNRG